ncbi:hypothetical protein AMECASPLE_025853, partial [Ameca splendens]
QEEHQGLQQEIIKIPRMKIAVIGQSVFGQEVYKELRKDGHTIVGVFTIPDKDSKADPLEERKGLNDYGIEQCEARIQELLQVNKNPPKDRRVSDVLGQLNLLYQRRLMLEVYQRVKLQFELNDTLQTVDVLRGELTEVENRLETIEGSHATPPPWRNEGGELKPTSQVETFGGEPHL